MLSVVSKLVLVCHRSSSAESPFLLKRSNEIIDAAADSADISKSDGPLDVKGFSLISSFTNGGVNFGTWAQSSDSTEAKRSLWNREIHDIPLEKRATNIEGRFCATQCAYQNVSKANPNDCKTVYQGIYATTGVFHLPPSKSKRKSFSIPSPRKKRSTMLISVSLTNYRASHDGECWKLCHCYAQ